MRLVVIATLCVCLGVEASPQGDGRQRALQILESYDKSGRVGGVDDFVTLESFLPEVAPQWLARTPGPLFGREKIALLVLEVVSKDFSRQIGLVEKQPQLIEWACELLRGPAPTTFEQVWLRASLALLPYGAHAEHARKRFPDDPWFRLAEVVSRPEARVVSRRGGADPGKLTRHQSWGQLTRSPERSSRPNQTAQVLASLAADPAVGVDARIHLGTIQFLIGKVQESALTLQQAAGEAQSDFERNFAWLMAGFALETLQRTDDALLAFENAVRAMPSARTSALALATRLALKGGRVEAEGVAAQALTSRDSIEPWLYPVAVYGRARDNLAQLRRFVGFDAGALPNSPGGVGFKAPTFRQQPADTSPLSPARGGLVFSTRTTRVGVDVSVTQRGRLVPDLGPGDFQLFEDGVPQRITSVTRESMPLDVSIVLDLADPVYTVDGGKLTFYPPDQSVQDVRGMAGRLAKVDRIRVIAATTEVHEVARMQAVTPELPLGSLEQIPVARVTSALNDAIALALLHQSPSDRRHVVVVFSDGIDGASVTDEGVLLKLAAQSDAILFYVRRDPMGLFGERNRSRMAAMQTSQQLWPTNARVFEDIADSTGGAVRDQPINASMVPAFNDILLNLRERYVLWYAPENVKPGWHKTTVKVQRDGNYKLDARQGYFAR